MKETEPAVSQIPEESMAETIVEMRNVTKRFPGIVANDDISLKIQKGEIFALLGENGAGKSTLMSMLFGMYEPDEGEILIRGKKVRIKTPSEAVALDIGMVHQHFKLVSNYTVAENIILGKEPLKRKLGFLPSIDRKGANEQIQALADRYDFGLKATALIEDLEISSQQRVEILKMLYREAEILIFDEPTALLSPQETAQFLQIIKKLHADGKTIILITHKLGEIKEVAHRCGILNHGRLIEVIDARTTSTELMAQKMVGRKVSFDLPKPPPSFGEAILEVDGLTVIDAQKVVKTKDICFKVHEGEVLAIAGVAGNGQTEITDALAGLLPAKQGRICFRGKDITSATIRERSFGGLSYIPEDRQEVGLILDFSLSENLSAKSYRYKPFAKGPFLQPGEFKRHALELIEKYDIRCADGPATSARSMSGGNQQKAVIAREVDQDGKLVIFVQPTRGLDIGATMDIRARIVDERNKGKAVLLVSFDLDEILSCADTIGVMYNGELVKVAPVDNITRDEIGELMIGVHK